MAQEDFIIDYLLIKLKLRVFDLSKQGPILDLHHDQQELIWFKLCYYFYDLNLVIFIFQLQALHNNDLPQILSFHFDGRLLDKELD